MQLPALTDIPLDLDTSLFAFATRATALRVRLVRHENGRIGYALDRHVCQGVRHTLPGLWLTEAVAREVADLVSVVTGEVTMPQLDRDGVA